MTSARIACGLAAAIAVAPLVPGLRSLAPGFTLFFAWAMLCVAAVFANRPLLWALLCAVPMALVSWDWLQGPRDDGFGFYPWGSIALFLGVALTVGATACLFLARMTAGGLSGRP